MRRCGSPTARASTSSKLPPLNICIPDAIEVEVLIGYRLAYTEPAAHATDARRLTPTATKLIDDPVIPAFNPSPTNSATPAIPMNTPSSTFPFGRVRLNAQFNTTTHNGSVVISNAANPDGMYFSAQVTPPLPPSNNNPPIASALGHCENDERILSPLKRAHVKRIAPANENRVPAMRKGGSVSIA